MISLGISCASGLFIIQELAFLLKCYHYSFRIRNVSFSLLAMPRNRSEDYENQAKENAARDKWVSILFYFQISPIISTITHSLQFQSASNYSKKFILFQTFHSQTSQLSNRLRCIAFKNGFQDLKDHSCDISRMPIRPSNSISCSHHGNP